MRSRIVFILIALTSLWALMIARAAYLQVLPNERLQALQRRQFETVVKLNPRRGDVLDRNGHELAVSMTKYSLYADPKIIEAPRRTAQMLAREIKMAPKAIEEKLRQKKKRFVWIGRLLSKEARDAIDGWHIRGLGFVEESQRVYPNDRLLSQVLGFVGEDGQGLEGLESKYNEQLQGESVKVNMRKDARGRPLIINGQIFNQVPDGSDIQLTIDRELQFMLEQELADAMTVHDADSAVGVILDAQTSEILAMSSAPTFDLNRSGDFSPERRRNRAVTDAFEPGSTLKTFVIAGAMARGLIEPNSKFDCEGGVMRIGKRVIHEAETHEKFGQLTVTEILAHSSNVGATKIGFKLGAEGVRESLKSFGFGERTGVDLPGEAKGIMQALPWHEHLLANISFGHGVTASALQIANAYAVIANGGYLKQPYIVKTVFDHESNEKIEKADAKSRSIRRVLTDDQVAKMRIMLTNVTSDFGNSANARVPGFPVAGKTGTAQKVNPNGRGYIRGGYISSFAGFLPANDPKFVIYVALDHPKKGYYGSAVAAPVFSRIAKFAVRRAGLAPVLINQDNVISQARREPAQEKTRVRPIEDFAPGGAVAAQRPKSKDAGSALRASAVDSLTAVDPIGERVPDLTGLTAREVMARVSGTDIRVRLHGQGYVSRTSPEFGAELAKSKSKELNVYLE